MPDMTVCVNTECPSRSACYRYRVAHWNEYGQSVSRFKDVGGRCSSFSPIKGGDQILTEAASARRARGVYGG